MKSPHLLTNSIIAATVGAISAAIILMLFQPANTGLSREQPLEQRIERLEQGLINEQEARLAQITALTNERNQLSSINRPGANTAVDQALVSGDQQPDALLSQESLSSAQSLDAQSQLSPKQQRHQALINAGFSDDEAQNIAQQESEVALLNLNRQHQARRELLQQSADDRLDNFSQNNVFRDKLGDDGYEKYLASRGLPTNIDVATVLSGSVGESAGLQFGDKITHYNGERIFNVRELNRLTLQGNEGENVYIEVERDSETIQVAIPRGPIGITSSNPFNRRFQR